MFALKIGDAVLNALERVSVLRAAHYRLAVMGQGYCNGNPLFSLERRELRTILSVYKRAAGTQMKCRQTTRIPGDKRGMICAAGLLYPV